MGGPCVTVACLLLAFTSQANAVGTEAGENVFARLRPHKHGHLGRHQHKSSNHAVLASVTQHHADSPTTIHVQAQPVALATVVNKAKGAFLTSLAPRHEETHSADHLVFESAVSLPIAAATDGTDTPDAAQDDKENGSNVMASDLGVELAEVKQRRMNVVQVEQALTAEVALLRESTAMARVSKSRRGRSEAEQQVRQSEQLVKETEGMVKESRAAAADGARAVLHQVKEVRSTLDAMTDEASKQLKLFGSPH